MRSFPVSLPTESAKSTALGGHTLSEPCPVSLQIESAKAGSERTTGSREEQDELELPNFRRPARGSGLPLLGQVCPVSLP